MTRDNDLVRLRHMLDHAIEAVDMAEGHSRYDLDDDRQLNLALVRLVEIVGEAAARVGPEMRKRCPAVPWLEIIGMRNRIVHGYDQVDLDILWDVIDLHLPPLIIELKQILSTLGNGVKEDKPDRTQ
ncbi:MAG: HepT-like ribonuclease domain-containing protein [bacterium]